MARAILLLSCPDQKGLVARLSHFVFSNGGNIIDADQHTDFTSGLFLTRLEWDLDGFLVGRAELPAVVATLASDLGARWELHLSDVERRVAIFVTKQDHCLVDLLWRVRAGELAATVPLVISNHEDLRGVTEQLGVPYRCIPVDPANKRAQEEQQLALLREHRIDLVLLAKYMQVVTAEFLAAAPPVINIHHSFLPAFAGARPYHRAHERGVKIIGATAHYATADLDEGPIIEQQVTRVSHRDTVADLIRKGRDLERIVLATAVRHHLENRVLVYRNRTVVFG